MNAPKIYHIPEWVTIGNLSFQSNPCTQCGCIWRISTWTPAGIGSKCEDCAKKATKKYNLSVSKMNKESKEKP